MLSTSFAARHPGLLRRVSVTPPIDNNNQVSEYPKEAGIAVAHSQLRAVPEKADAAGAD